MFRQQEKMSAHATTVNRLSRVFEAHKRTRPLRILILCGVAVERRLQRVHHDRQDRALFVQL